MTDEPVAETPAADGPTPYWQIPLIVLVCLAILGLILMSIATAFLMADWIPSVVEDGTRHYGADALSEVYFKWMVRALLVSWPVLTIIGIVGEKASRRAA